MDAIDLQLACPVCATAFPRERGAAFALHVTDCTTPAAALTSSSSTFSAVVIDGIATASSAAAAAQIRSCALCHHVYASGTAEHVVDFHEYECTRANKRKGKVASGAGASAGRQQGKRPREPLSTHADDEDGSSDVAAAATATPLFPPHCALCGVGGRALLHCGGDCIRAFHAACIDGVMAGNSKSPSAAVTGLSSVATQLWRCAECVRGVHACASCGFLGHASNTLAKCSVPNCGFFLHSRTCLPSSASATAPLVCPRHTCSKCSGVETDMRACTSCSQCFTAAHTQCASAAAKPMVAAAAKTTSLRGATSSASDAAHFVLCDVHASRSSSSSSSRAPDATLALKYRVQQGDVVLLLEFANALLPQSAKHAAPDACNQWGIVTRAEDIDGRDQLLAVSIFSDGSVVSVPNQYVLPLGTANAYASPQVMLRDCIKWHAVTELNLRAAELDAAAAADAAASTTAKMDETRDQILNASCSAFYARAEKLALSIAQLFSAAREGFVFWSTHRAELRKFAGSSAPIYVFMDTRAPSKSADSEASSGATRVAHSASPSGGAAGDNGDDDDVDMEDASGHRAAQSGDIGGAGVSSGNAVGSSDNTRRAAHALDAVDTATVVAAALHDIVASIERVAASSSAVLPRSECDSALASVEKVEKVEKIEKVENVTAPPSLDGVAYMEVDAGASYNTPTKSVSAASPHAHHATTLVDGVAVVTDVKFAATDDDDGDDSDDSAHAVRETKRQKLSPVASSAKPSPSPPNSNTFVRERAALYTPAMKQTPSLVTRKERMLSEYSPQLMHALERQAAAFLEHEANPGLAAAAARRSSRKSPSPKFCDAFPSASTPEAFRPPYFRPSVVFNRARGRRLEGLSRLLLSQDKRNIKCFIQGTAENKCIHGPAALRAVHAEGTFVTIDLLSVDSFHTLEVAIRTRMIAAVEQDDRSLKEMLGVSAERARRLLQERKHDKLAIEIYYCSYDGSRAKVVRGQDDWLCFCANVCHLTAVIPLQASE